MIRYTTVIIRRGTASPVQCVIPQAIPLSLPFEDLNRDVRRLVRHIKMRGMPGLELRRHFHLQVLRARSIATKPLISSAARSMAPRSSRS